MQWTGGKEGARPILDWIHDCDLIAQWVDAEPERYLPGLDETGDILIPAVPEHIFIPTLEGTMAADVGDWIIRGVAGEFYPCKSDIFEKTYEEVLDDV